MKDARDIQDALEGLSKATGLKLRVEEKWAEHEDSFENAVETIKDLTKAYKEKYDRAYYMKQLLEGRSMESEKSGRGSRYRLDPETLYALFLVSCRNSEQKNAAEVLRQLSPSLRSQQILFMDAETLVVLRAVHTREEGLSLEQDAYMMADTINAEVMTPVRVVFSEAAVFGEDLAGAYQEQRLALQIHQVFSPGKTVISSDQIGMGRLVSAVPESVCRAYIKEVTGRDRLNKMDSELVSTLECFLNNSLNIAETARRLHVHRNTLLYRLEQIRKMTGLDIRCFHDAMACRMLIYMQLYLEREKEL